MVADLPAAVGLEAVEAEVVSLLVDMVEGRDPVAFAVAVDAGLAGVSSLGLPFCLVGVACVSGEADCSVGDDTAGTDAAGLSCDSGWNGDPLRSCPRFSVTGERADPPDTAFVSFGSAGVKSALSSSSLDIGFSGFLCDVLSVWIVNSVGKAPFGPFGGMAAVGICPLADECVISAMPLPLVLTCSAILTGEGFAGDLIRVVLDS